MSIKNQFNAIVDTDLESINRILGRGRYILVGATFADKNVVEALAVKMVGIDNQLGAEILARVADAAGKAAR